MATVKGQHFECCMCGDSGLPYELFRCKVCRFRSQHRYCSNLYPKANSYRLCNWCLVGKGESVTRSTTLSGNKICDGDGKPDRWVKKRKIVRDCGGSDSGGGVKVEETANGSMTRVTRNAFRSKVRRYKLLEEVSMQGGC